MSGIPGYRHTDEAKQKMSLAKLGTKRKFTPEHRAALSAAWHRRKQREEEQDGKPTPADQRIP